MFLKTLPMLLVVRGLAFVVFGIDGGLWRYAGIWDLWRIVLAVFSSSLVLFISVYGPLTPAVYPRSVVIIDALVLICLLGGLRLVWRMLPYLAHVTQINRGRRVLIIGAGDAGDMIVRKWEGASTCRSASSMTTHRKLGGTSTASGARQSGHSGDCRATKPVEALVAIPSAPPAVIHSFVHLLEGFKIPITTVPSLSELVNGNVGVKEIRPMAIEDLLPRNQVALNTAGVSRLIAGKRVLVTGAGGSIGSELCRQIATFGPSDLVLFERYENSLYTIVNDLTDRPIVPKVQRHR